MIEKHYHLRGQRVVARQNDTLDPGRRTLVLLHGAGCNHHFFDAVIPHLNGVNVIVPAFPGRCGSAGEPLDRVVDMAEWVGELLELLALPAVILGGHSMGGGVAIEYALPATKKVAIEALILLGTGGRLRARPEVLRAMRNAVKEGAIADVGRFAYHRSTPEELVDAAEGERNKTPSETSLADWFASNGFDRLDAVSGIDRPTLIVAGRDDIFTPLDYSEYLHAHIAASELHILDNAGHMFPVERGAEVAGWIAGFLRKT